MPDRFAFLVGSYAYEQEPKLKGLRGPPNDIAALDAVLADPQIGGFVTQTSINEPSATVLERIDGFLSDRHPDDVALLYFSGHGVKDSDGKLYFATANTRLSRLPSTALKSPDLNELLHRSRARQKMLLLDCCYSGAFARGMHVRGGSSVGTHDYFDGRGHAVLTASDAIQYAFEDGVQQHGEAAPQSIFTRVLVEGLASGSADRDGDGAVTFDELYDYVHEQVCNRTPSQTPRKWALDQQGRLVVARVPATKLKAAQLPRELLDTVQDPRPWVRKSAIEQLLPWLTGEHPGKAIAARQALERLCVDDSDSVKAAAKQALQQYGLKQNANVTQAAPDAVKTRDAKPRLRATRAQSVRRQVVPTLDPGPPEHAAEPANDNPVHGPLASVDASVDAGPGRFKPRSVWFWSCASAIAVAIPLVIGMANRNAGKTETNEVDQLYRANPQPSTTKPILASAPEPVRDTRKVERSAATTARPGSTTPIKPVPATEPPRNAPSASKVFRDRLQDGSEGPAMVVIRAGEFMMGSPAGEIHRGSDEGPQHRVAVRSFLLGQTEVTFDDYDRFARATNRALPADYGWGRGTRPVIGVSWSDADAFARWLSGQTGREYRLPSEAEWEYAARAGTRTPHYMRDGVYSWQANCGNQIGKTQSVGSYAINGFGLHDMYGNVWEWVQDCWHDNYEGAPGDGSAWLSDSCAGRVLRGGSWATNPLSLRSANRDWSSGFEVNYIGFRLARTR